jgi:hypothetical protein
MPKEVYTDMFFSIPTEIQNDNLTRAEIYEQKKWLMDRGNDSLQLSDEDYRLTIRKFDTISNEATSKLLKRNSTLTSVTFVATVILGLVALNLFKGYVSSLIVALFIDVLVGISVFIVLTVLRYLIAAVLTDLQTAANEAQDTLIIARNLLYARMFLALDSVTIRQFHVLYAYMNILNTLSRVKIFKAYKKASTSRLLTGATRLDFYTKLHVVNMCYHIMTNSNTIIKVA